MSAESNQRGEYQEQDRQLARYFAERAVPPPSMRLTQAILRDASAVAQARSTKVPALVALRELWRVLGGWRMLVPSAATGMALALAVLGSNVDLGPSDESVDVLSQAMFDEQYEDFAP